MTRALNKRSAGAPGRGESIVGSITQIVKLFANSPVAAQNVFADVKPPLV
jgi:hypothetical protein